MVAGMTASMIVVVFVVIMLSLSLSCLVIAAAFLLFGACMEVVGEATNLCIAPIRRVVVISRNYVGLRWTGDNGGKAA